LVCPAKQDTASYQDSFKRPGEALAEYTSTRLMNWIRSFQCTKIRFLLKKMKLSANPFYLTAKDA